MGFSKVDNSSSSVSGGLSCSNFVATVACFFRYHSIALNCLLHGKPLTVQTPNQEVANRLWLRSCWCSFHPQGRTMSYPQEGYAILSGLWGLFGIVIPLECFQRTLGLCKPARKPSVHPTLAVFLVLNCGLVSLTTSSYGNSMSLGMIAVGLEALLCSPRRRPLRPVSIGSWIWSPGFGFLGEGITL